jgi:ssDNA-specific exonuclease RecJ
MWRREGAIIKNQRGKVMEVDNGTDDENRNIIAKPRNGKIYQQFDIIYVDTWKGDPTTGQFNKFYGLYVNRPFYIISHMGQRRYLDIINNKNVVIKIRNGRSS